MQTFLTKQVCSLFASLRRFNLLARLQFLMRRGNLIAIKKTPHHGEINETACHYTCWGGYLFRLL